MEIDDSRPFRSPGPRGGKSERPLSFLKRLGGMAVSGSVDGLRLPSPIFQFGRKAARASAPSFQRFSSALTYSLYVKGGETCSRCGSARAGTMGMNGYSFRLAGAFAKFTILTERTIWCGRSDVDEPFVFTGWKVEESMRLHAILFFVTCTNRVVSCLGDAVRFRFVVDRSKRYFLCACSIWKMLINFYCKKVVIRWRMFRSAIQVIKHVSNNVYKRLPIYNILILNNKNSD